MARTRMVTRTINVTEYTVLTVNTETQSVTSEIYALGIPSLTLEKALSVLKKAYETDTIKLVSITNTETHEECYGMLETDFLAQAKRLDPVTRKLLDTGLEFISDTEDLETEEN